jgi:predicted N-acetyltransferase YhbS
MATDMLVDLRTFTLGQPARYSEAHRDVEVRRAIDSDREQLSTFVVAAFIDENWGRATAVAYTRHPTSAFVALRAGEILGFAFYDIAFRGYFGPTGVSEVHRGGGIGACLLVAALNDMALKGYAYAVIGDVGPVEFYEKVCRATVIAQRE